MAYGEWIGEVAYDVTWSWKVKVLTQIYFNANISKPIRDRALLPVDSHQEMAWQIDWSRDRWRHVTLKGQGHDLNIFLKVTGHTDLGTMEHILEMLTGVSDGHVTVDVMWPWKVKVGCKYLENRWR